MVRVQSTLLTIAAAFALVGPVQAQQTSAATSAKTAFSTAKPTTTGSEPTPSAEQSTPQPAAKAPAPDTASTTAPAAPSSDIILKKARTAGFKPETHDGVTWYCKKDDKPDTGTHFIAPKRCYTQAQVLSLLDQTQQDREWLRNITQTNPNGK